MKPATLVVVARRAALRRRFGYAALRVLRSGLRRALAEHQARQLDVERRYAGAGMIDAIGANYRAGLRRLLRRWPALNLTDPRSEP